MAASTALVKYDHSITERDCPKFLEDGPVWITPAVRSAIEAVEGIQEKSVAVKRDLIAQVVSARQGLNSDSSGTKVAIVMACKSAICELIRTMTMALETLDESTRDLNDSARSFVQDLLGKVYLRDKDELVSRGT